MNEQDRPQVILRDRRNVFGDNYQQITLQSNRVSRSNELASTIAESLRPPGLPGALVGDSLLWMASSGLVWHLIKAIRLLIPGTYLVLCTVFFALILGLLGSYLVKAVPGLEGILAYRCLLIVIGFMFGFLGV
jgi:hypothetical protein